MREVFHQSLEEVQSRLVEISELVTVAIDKATKAFGTSDVALAEEVIAGDAVIDEKSVELDELARPARLLRTHAARPDGAQRVRHDRRAQGRVLLLLWRF